MFLIDGYNLLHAMVRGRATSEARDRLIGLIEAFCRRGGYSARIVFDPTAELPRKAQRGPLEIRGVAQGRTADDEIIAELEATDDRTAYTVVTNDRAIVQEAHKRKVEVISCEDFARRLRDDEGGGRSGKRDDVPPGEVDYWMREFGLDEPER